MWPDWIAATLIGLLLALTAVITFAGAAAAAFVEPTLAIERLMGLAILVIPLWLALRIVNSIFMRGSEPRKRPAQ